MSTTVWDGSGVTNHSATEVLENAVYQLQSCRDQ